MAGPDLQSPFHRWVFLFDKAMLMCCKARGGLYAPKEMYQVAQLRVEPMPAQAVPKVHEQSCA